jgi:hypothetical protein
MSTWRTAGHAGLQPKTLEDSYGFPLQQVRLPWCERRGITEPRELDNRTLKQLTSDLLEVVAKRGKLSRFTVDTHVHNVNPFLRWCRREGEIGDVRAQSPKLARRVLDVLSRDEHEAAPK